MIEISIGMGSSGQEVKVKLAENYTRDEVKGMFDKAAASAEPNEIFWLVDNEGNDIGFSSANVAYLKIDSSAVQSGFGFGG